MGFIKGVIEFIMDILETVVFIGSLFMVIYLFICQPNKIQGASMEPTFYTGEYIFTSKVTYKFRPLERGDVVVIHAPENYEIEYIKRVIGLPGDTLLFKEGEVYLNGNKLTEPYISDKTPVWGFRAYAKEDQPFVIAKGEVFVLGDNRPKSKDSREFGPIPISSIIGQVFYRYFPTTRMGPINNPVAPAIRDGKGLTYIFQLDNVSKMSFKV
jgi:signal peptidase I